MRESSPVVPAANVNRLAPSSGLEKKIAAGFLMGLGILLVIGVVSYRNTKRLSEAREWVDHTHRVLEEIDSIILLLGDAETSSRGYVITGQDRYLEPYRHTPDMRKQLEQLRILTHDNPLEQQKTAVLELLVRKRMNIIQETISLRKSQGFDAALKKVLTDEGRQTMEQIRQVAGEMKAEETRLLRQRAEEEKTAAQTTISVVLIGSVVALVLVSLAALLIHRDIGQRRRAEEEVRRAEEEMDRFFTLSLDMFCVAGFDGYFKRLNPAWERALGFTTEELLSKPYLDFIHPEDRPKTIAEAARVSEGSLVLSFENRYLSKDGSFKWFLWNAVPFPEGQLIYAAARDITERKKTEDRFRLVVESAPNAIILVDSKGTIRLVNVQAENYFGYHPNELLGKKIEMLVPKENSVDHTTLRSSFFSHPDVRSMGKGRDLFGLRKDGSKIPIEVGLNPIHFEEEMLVLASIIDITDRKKAEEALLNSKTQLETANKELEAFSYSVSHDLRAPLRHIDGFADLLNRNASANLDERSKRHLRTISESAKQMGKLIDDLLVFSRMGRSELRKSHVNLQLLAEDILRDFHQEMRERIIEWKIDPLPEVHGDPSMLRLVMVNLISNALKYTGTRERARVEIGCVSGRRDGPVFFVRDNGVGFDMKYADKLFGVFQRLHRSDEFEGAGIGLANVRRIIVRHGGSTWAEGAVDAGATFYFSLPQEDQT